MQTMVNLERVYMRGRRRNLPFRKRSLPLLTVVATYARIGLWVEHNVRSFAMAGNGDGPQPERQKKHSLKAATGWNVFYKNVAVS